MPRPNSRAIKTRVNPNQPLKKTDDEVANIAKTVGTFNDDELRNNFLDLVLQLSVTDQGNHLDNY